MKKISAGLILTDGEKMLVCHSTGNKFYDIPKGMKEENEEAITACIRETREETGLNVEGKKLIDLGLFSYTKQKNLHLFLLIEKNLPSTETMVCHSYFDHPVTKKRTPEVDGFKYISFSEKEKYVTKNMANVLDNVLDKAKSYLK